MKKILFLSIAIFSIVYMSSCEDSVAKSTTTTTTTSTTTNNTVETVGAVSHVGNAEFKDLISKNTGELIDVRTPKEHAAGAIAGTSLNIDVSNRNFKDAIGKLDRDKTYLVYCRSGGRSSRAVKIMESMGFKNLFNLKHGYKRWK